MHVISRKILTAFWAIHPDARRALHSWHGSAKKAHWSSIVEVRTSHPHADAVDDLTIFNICGNKYRLIAAIHYNSQKVFIRHVMTHAEYDKGRWRNS